MINKTARSKLADRSVCTIKLNNMALKLSNYNKKSHPRWRLVGNFCVYAIPIYTVAIVASPLDPQIKGYIELVLTIISVTIKGISQLTIDPNFNENN